MIGEHETVTCIEVFIFLLYFFFSSRRRHTRSLCDWSSDVCSSDLSPTVSFRSWRPTISGTDELRGLQLRKLTVGLDQVLRGNSFYRDQIGRASCRERV